MTPHAPAAALLAWLALATSSHAQFPPSPVRVDPARAETVGEKRLVTGDVRARRTSLVASREAGVLLELPVREGDLVAAGDLLGKLDGTRLELEVSVIAAQVDSARALVTERENDVAQTVRDLETLRDLASRSAANPKELADAETAAAVARARRDQALLDVAILEARRALLTQRLADTTLRAPFDGLVVRRSAEVGQWVGEGNDIVELVSHDDLEAWLEVPQRYLAATRANAKTLHMRLDATGEEFDASDPRILAIIDPLARTFSIITPIPAGKNSFAAGMSVTAWVPTGATTERITVSPDAILRNDVGTFIYVAQPPADDQSPHVAMPMPVTVLFRTDDRVVVDAARLAPGTPIVVEGNERLFPMAPIAPQPAAGNETSNG
jgi:RND family efflux transporter MFP subunit